jgi:EPS-associated MarR family transcriptional regulator
MNKGESSVIQLQNKNLESEEALKIFREIHGNPRLTQRELSSRLGISLGKINYLLKALIDRGFVKAGHFKNSKNKKAYLYILTPFGIEAKAKATYHFLKRKMEEYERLQQEIRELQSEAVAADAQPGAQDEARP